MNTPPAFVNDTGTGVNAPPPRRRGYRGRTMRARGDHEYGTLAVVLEVLRAAGQPLTAGRIAELAGNRLPTRASGPTGRRNVVSRDLCRELARGDASRVTRVSAAHQCTTWAVRS